MSIVTAHLQALAVTADKIAAGSITADKIAAGSITADKIAAGQLATTNYAEDGSGNPTAGAKLDHQGTALKVAPGNLQIGPNTAEALFLGKSTLALGALFNTSGAGYTWQFFPGDSSWSGHVDAIDPGNGTAGLRLYWSASKLVPNPIVLAAAAGLPGGELAESWRVARIGQGTTGSEFYVDVVVLNASGARVNVMNPGAQAWFDLLMIGNLWA